MSVDPTIYFSYLQDRYKRIDLSYLGNTKKALTASDPKNPIISLIQEIESADTNHDRYLDVDERDVLNNQRLAMNKLGINETHWRNFRRLMFKSLDADQRVASLKVNRLMSYLEVYNEGLKFAQLSAAKDFTPIKSICNMAGFTEWGNNLATSSAQNYYEQRQVFLQDIKAVLANGIMAKNHQALNLDIDWVLQNMPNTYDADTIEQFSGELRLHDIANALGAATPFERSKKILELADNEIADGNAAVDNYFQIFQNNHNNGFARSVFTEISGEMLFGSLSNYAQIRLNQVTSSNENGNYVLEESQATASRLAEAGVELLAWRYLPSALWRKAARPALVWSSKGLAARNIPWLSKRATNLVARFAATDKKIADAASIRRHWAISFAKNWWFAAMATGLSYATAVERTPHEEAPAASFLGRMIDYEKIDGNDVLNSDLAFLSRLEPWSSQLQTLPNMEFTITSTIKDYDPDKLVLQRCDDAICSSASDVYEYKKVLNTLSCEADRCQAIIEDEKGTFRVFYHLDEGFGIASNSFNFQNKLNLQISVAETTDDGSVIPKLVVTAK